MSTTMIFTFDPMPFDNQIATSIYNTSSQGKRCETSFEVSPHTSVPYAKFSCRPPPLPSIVSNETQLKQYGYSVICKIVQCRNRAEQNMMTKSYDEILRQS